MTTVVLVIHLLIAVALVGVILLQKSEGGALGIGGGGAGGFLTARGGANLLTRTTAVLAVLFVCTSLVLAILASQARGPSSILDAPAPVPAAPAAPAPVAPAEPAPPVAN
jgi:preprotein translocase subunit SecG